jgi:hypothetical protein
VVERFLRGRVSAPAWLRWALVLNLVVLGWILFRSRDLGLAGDFLARFGDIGPATLWTAPVLLCIGVTIGLQLLPQRPLEQLRFRFAQLQPAALGVALALVVAFVGATVPANAVPPFIYFQF